MFNYVEWLYCNVTGVFYNIWLVVGASSRGAVPHLHFSLNLPEILPHPITTPLLTTLIAIIGLHLPLSAFSSTNHSHCKWYDTLLIPTLQATIPPRYWPIFTIFNTQNTHFPTLYIAHPFSLANLETPIVVAIIIITVLLLTWHLCYFSYKFIQLYRNTIIISDTCFYHSFYHLSISIKQQLNYILLHLLHTTYIAISILPAILI